MQRIRIVTAGAFLSAMLFVSGLAGGSALAQTAAAGKPLELLKIEHSAPAGRLHARSAVKSAARSSHKTRLAAKTRTKQHHFAARTKRPHAPVLTAETTAPADIPQPVNPGPQAETAAAVPTPLPASTLTAQTPSEVVVAGQTVQVTSPNEVNSMDLAASDHAANDHAGDDHVAQTTDAAPSIASAAPPPPEAADAQSKAGSLTAAAAEPHQSKVGSTSWLLQVMAALGGAVTAGSLAWFLIGSTPQRTYG
jgi:hypothetical protein